MQKQTVCGIMDIITYSLKDTKETQRQVIKNNAKYRSICEVKK